MQGKPERDDFPEVKDAEEKEDVVNQEETWQVTLGQVRKVRNGIVRRVLILRTGVAGLSHRLRKYGDFGQTLLDMIHTGDLLRLVREKDNDCDPFAVSVHTTTKLKLGYLPRFKNEPVARLMDLGFRVAAFVDAPPEADIVWSATEDMRVPISVYLIL